MVAILISLVNRKVISMVAILVSLFRVPRTLLITSHGPPRVQGCRACRSYSSIGVSAVQYPGGN